MKINFDQKIVNLEGKPMMEQTQDNDGERGPDREVTLGRACVNALLTPEDKKVDGPEKLVRFELAKKIYKGGEVDLETDEISKIKGLVGDVYGVLVTGRAWKLLEKKEDEDTTVDEKEDSSGPN
jgi:hypothetical protein